jgi:hypothetical protein
MPAPCPPGLPSDSQSDHSSGPGPVCARCHRLPWVVGALLSPASPSAATSTRLTAFPKAATAIAVAPPGRPSADHSGQCACGSGPGELARHTLPAAVTTAMSRPSARSVGATRPSAPCPPGLPSDSQSDHLSSSGPVCQRCHTIWSPSVATKTSRRPSSPCWTMEGCPGAPWPGLPNGCQPVHSPLGPSCRACHGGPTPLSDRGRYKF